LPRHLWIGFCCLLLLVVGGVKTSFERENFGTLQTTTTKSYKGDIDLYKGEILIGGGDGGKTTP